MPPTPNAERNRALWRFLVPATLGAAFLLVPVRYNGSISIVLGHLVDEARASWGNVLPVAVVTVVVLSAVVSLALRVVPRFGAGLPSGWREILCPSWQGLTLRVSGAVLTVLVFAQVGPEWLIGEATGQVILGDLMTVIFIVFFVASFLLPCLTDYGLMEFVGGFTSAVFRPVFGLPGRSAVDAVASWLGAASVGVLITADQYERGFYTEREAAVIATNFSVVSIAFAYVIIDFVGLGDHFVPFYAAIVVCGLVSALVCPLLPPLSRKPDRTIDGRTRKEPPRTSTGADTPGATPLEAALARAAESPSFGDAFRRGCRLVVDVWFGLLPAVAVIGTGAIVLAETTPLFRWLGMPFAPLLELFRVPEAQAAAPAMVVGFADQFLPAVLGRTMESEVTRFVVACACVNQLIYMSEVGILILRSALPLRLLDLALIFVWRTLLTLPVAAGAAHLLF